MHVVALAQAAQPLPHATIDETQRNTANSTVTSALLHIKSNFTGFTHADDGITSIAVFYWRIALSSVRSCCKKDSTTDSNNQNLNEPVVNSANRNK